MDMGMDVGGGWGGCVCVCVGGGGGGGAYLLSYLVHVPTIPVRPLSVVQVLCESIILRLSYIM